MQQPFGHTLKFRLLLSHGWFSLGPGWAAIAGALSTGQGEFNYSHLLQLVGLWLLVDPLLGVLWELAVQQRLWRRLVEAQLPPAPRYGFSLPYAQPGSPGGQFVLYVRRYRLWWQELYWPEFGDQVATFFLSAVLALAIAVALRAAIFWLTALATVLILFVAFKPVALTDTGGGRLQTVVQLFLPWLMGILLWSNLTPFSLALAVCYGVVYLGGLRMLGQHRRAEWLFFGGQVAVVLLLLGVRLLPGAAVGAALLVAQRLLKAQSNQADAFLEKAQPFLIIEALAAGWSLGTLLS
jgi:hypothetical protein